VSFRVAGAALLFWVASLFAKRGMCRCATSCSLPGLPYWASCVTRSLHRRTELHPRHQRQHRHHHSMPIFAMVHSFFILREPITRCARRRVVHRLQWCRHPHSSLTAWPPPATRWADVRGDMMCMGAPALFCPLPVDVQTVSSSVTMW
jgi:hypothetical protein